MGFFDGIGANLLRSGPDASGCYAPLGRFGPVYLVPDDHAAVRLTRDWRRFSAGILAFVLVGGLTIGWSGWMLTAMPFIAAVATVPFCFWTARQLPRAPYTAADLQPLSRAAAFANQSRAIGRPTLRIALILSAALTVLTLAVTLWSRRGELWLSTGFPMLCTVSIYLQFRQSR